MVLCVEPRTQAQSRAVPALKLENSIMKKLITALALVASTAFATEPAKAAETKPAATETKPATAETQPAATETKPADVKAEAPKAEKKPTATKASKKPVEPAKTPDTKAAAETH
jgi:hypothetical protein